MMNSEKTLEENICHQIINLSIKEATNLIRENDLVYHVLEQDGETFPRKDQSYISSRINLIVRKGRIIGTEIY